MEVEDRRPIAIEECMADSRPNEMHGDYPRMEVNEEKGESARIMRIDRHRVGSKEDKGMHRKSK